MRVREQESRIWVFYMDVFYMDVCTRMSKCDNKVQSTVLVTEGMHAYILCIYTMHIYYAYIPCIYTMHIYHVNIPYIYTIKDTRYIYHAYTPYTTELHICIAYI